MQRLLATIVVVVAFASPGIAGFLGGKDLHGHCTAPSIDERYICISYIMGVIDTTQHLLPRTDPGRACIPAGVGAQETIEKIIAYLKTDTERRDSPAEILIGHALKTVYPCKS
ncbi:MAG: hypothetical protein FJX60_10745 [Alphaproteobacteria bacterium]|nr:hypothetical protein [Alphaproteobacteria bacterium]